MNSFTESIKSFFANYFVLRGKATRAQYWWPTGLFFALTFLLASALLFIEENFGVDESVYNTLFSLWIIFITIPLFTVGIRRFLDAGIWFGFYLILAAFQWGADIIIFAGTDIPFYLFFVYETSNSTSSEFLLLITTFAALFIEFMLALFPSKQN